MNIPETIIWKPVKEKPDAEITVLLYAPNASEPVWPGYYDDQWRWADGTPARGVTHWADFPGGPKA